MGALQLPIVLSKLAYLIDNPWNVSLIRANAAGLILADSIIDRNLGKRPITLVGFSLGSRVIFSCLKELARKGAYGLIQNVYLFGSPIVANKDDYLRARSVVVGRFVNGYASNDWILGYLFRATSGGIMRVAGLAPVEGVPGLENVDVTNLVNGHMAYRVAIPRLLREVGWEVLSDEFAEIEDPDPDNHNERQRELIREIDEARKEAESSPEKKRFNLFKKSRLAEKRNWETYDPQKIDSAQRNSTDSASECDNILFDIDAIRNELASQQIPVKQLESTLPPMKLELRSVSEQVSTNSIPPKHHCPDLQRPKSADASSQAEKQRENQVSENRATQERDLSTTNLSHHPVATPSGEEDIQMTFDTSYHAYPSPPHRAFPTSNVVAKKPTRPELRCSATTPAAFCSNTGFSPGTHNLEHNAWAEDEMGQGGGSEIQLTFE